ncbi:MAG: hypothetical protein ABIA78_02615 [archaeon]
MAKKDLPTIKQKNMFWCGALVGLVGGVFGGLFANSFYDYLKDLLGGGITTILSGLVFLGIIYFASKQITKII